jgi:RNA polymerase sigma-70 factor (ECF subfamily)
VTEQRRRLVTDSLERFEGPLLQYAARVLGDAHAAQDVVQEAFIRLLEHDGEKDPRIPGWLYAVCRNLALDRRRRRKIMERTNAPALDGHSGNGEDPARRAARRDGAARALEALETLPARQREVLALRLRHGLKYREIAEVLDITANNVGVLVHQGMKTLRARLAEPVERPAVPAVEEVTR